MKILFSTDQIYLHGGIEKVMAEKANYFQEVLGYEVFILTTEQKNEKPCYTLSSNIQLLDINVNYHRNISYFHPNNLKKIPFHFKQWKKTIESINPDVIISCNYAFDFYWTPFFFNKIMKIREFHSSRYFEEIARNKASFIKKIKFHINDFIESKYDKIVLLTDDEKKFYRTNNTVVIPNPISLSSQKADLKSKKTIAAGRIAPIKGFDSLIQVWKRVVIQKPDWILDIYGQGYHNYLEELDILIKEMGLQQNVFIKPAASNLLEKMTDYSMYLMTSRTECFPMVLLESMSVGLPIISFDCPYGPRNIITNNKDGFVVENQNIELFAAKVIELIDNQTLLIEMGITAKKNVTRFTTEKIMEKWINLFNDKSV